MASPSISSLSKFVDAQSSASLTILRTYFSSSTDATLNVSVTITNIFLATSTASISTKIIGSPALTVYIDAGSKDSMKSSESRQYSAKVAELCDASTTRIDWKWTYMTIVGNPSFDSSSIISASKTASKLLINKNTLPGGYSYTFTATATATTSSGAKTSGSSSIVVSTTSSALVVVLSRPDGSISPSEDLKISGADSYDPDDSTTTLNYSWICANTNSDSECLGSDFKSLIQTKNSASLTISASRLTPKASYDFTLTVTQGIRSASHSVNLVVLAQNSQTTVEILVQTEKISSKSSYSVSPIIKTASGAKLTWSCISPTDLVISPNNLSKISIPANALKFGIIYTFQLVIDESSSIRYVITYPVKSNAGATCLSDLSVSPSSGKALDTDFTTKISDCKDTDEEDYPLYYTFSMVRNSINYVLATTKENSHKSILMPQVSEVSVEVCDQLASCTSYFGKVTVDSTGFSNGRKLIDVNNLYSTATLDTDKVPSFITLLATVVDIDQALFTKMWSDLQSYYISQNELSNNVFITLLAAVNALATQEWMSLALYEEFLNWIVSILKSNDLNLEGDVDKLNDLVFILSEKCLNYTIDYTKSENLAIEPHVLQLSGFLSQIANYMTKSELAGQNSMKPPLNEYRISMNKKRDLQIVHLNKSYDFSDITVILPSALPFDDDAIMNLRINQFKLISDEDYSDIFDLSFSSSGSYKNFEYKTEDEFEEEFSDKDNPIIIKVPYSKTPEIGFKCEYYSVDLGMWSSDGCKVIEFSAGLATISVTHFSVFRLNTIELNPPNENPEYTADSCNDNFAPIIILGSSFFIGMLAMTVLFITEKSKQYDLIRSELSNEIDTKQRVMSERQLDNSHRPVAPHQISEVIEIAPRVIEGNWMGNDQGERQIFQSSIKDDAITPDKSTIELKNEYKILKLLRCHLTFGLYWHQHQFPRWTRVFVILTVLLWQLLVEGLLFYGLEDFDSGKEKATKTLFDDYLGDYFGYTLLALAISIPVEICLTLGLSVPFISRKNKLIKIVSIMAGTILMCASFVGVVILDLQYCHEWSGYWAISWLWSILIEVLLLQTSLMLITYSLKKETSLKVK